MALGANKAALLGAAGSSTTSAYTIDQSIRFNQSDSAYLTKTFGGSASNRRTHTYSFWVKLGANASGNSSSGGAHFISTNDTGASAGDYLHLNGDLKLRYWSNESSASTFETTQLFRDYSAWYHIVLVNDRDNSVGSEAVRVYVNGQRVTNFAVDNISGRKSQDTMVNASSFLWMIGRQTSGTVHSDCYMADIVFIDGQALGPSSFGEYSDDGIWRPKDVSGLTFGTNGFYIDGRDSSDLGDDESGQGNDFTASGLAAHDQVFDTPTNNFAVINPIYADATSLNSVTLSEGNLDIDATSSAFDMKGMTFNLPKSGKWYFEYTIGGAYDGFGFCVVGQEASISASNGLGQLSTSQGGGIQYRGWRNGGNYTVTFSTYSSSSFTSGDIHQVAIDVDNGKWYYGISNTYYANDGGTDGNPSSGTNHLTTFDFAGNDVVLMTAVSTDSDEEHWNFGQNGTFNGTKTAQGNSDAAGVGNFYYSVPSGYKALCSKNVGS